MNTSNTFTHFTQALDRLPWNRNTFRASSRTAIIKAEWLEVDPFQAAQAIQQKCRDHRFEVSLDDIWQLWGEAIKEVTGTKGDTNA